VSACPPPPCCAHAHAACCVDAACVQHCVRRRVARGCGVAPHPQQLDACSACRR
jgi:hypothetical protein